MAVETLTYTYTSQTEIERLWSVTGALYRADDDSDGAAETNVWDDIVDEATDVVNLYILRWYDEEYATNNKWVRRVASIIGAYLLSTRRGNPPQFESQYERVMAQLEQVGSGTFRIPRLPMRDDFTPSMRNYRVDHRFRVPKIRTVQQISTGGVYSGEHVEPDYVYEWW